MNCEGVLRRVAILRQSRPVSRKTAQIRERNIEPTDTIWSGRLTSQGSNFGSAPLWLGGCVNAAEAGPSPWTGLRMDLQRAKQKARRRRKCDFGRVVRWSNAFGPLPIHENPTIIHLDRKAKFPS